MMNDTTRYIPRFILLAALATTLWCGVAMGQVQRADKLPEQYQDVGITAKPDARLPLDAEFVDETGRQVTLGDYFNGDKPVVMALVYYRCPMLCTLVVNGMTEALRQIDWTPGDEYEIVILSFNPAEGPELSHRKKLAYLSEFGREDTAGGWHFLTGEQQAIDRVTETIGFAYKWNDATREFVHDSAIYVVTPNGHMSKYLFGVQFEPRTVRLAMVEASKGRIGSITDKVTLLCSHFDPEEGTYAASAMLIMRATAVPAGIALVIVILIGIRMTKARRAKESQA